MNINSSISLLSNVHSITADFLTEKLAQQGFKEFASSHGNILFQLSIRNQLSMSELAKIINRDKSTTTVLVRKLETEGYVKVEPDPNDKRGRFVSLTDNGKKYNSITAEISKDLLTTFYKDFSEEEKEQFVSFLSRIKNNFQE